MCLKWRHSCGTEPFTCESVLYIQVDSVKTELNPQITSLVSKNCLLVWGSYTYTQTDIQTSMHAYMVHIRIKSRNITAGP